MRKRSGGSRTRASPSTPAGAAGRRRPRRSVADHSRHGRCSEPAVLAARGRRPDDGDPEQAVVDPGTGPRAHRAAEAVPVVGDEHGGTPAVPVPARSLSSACRGRCRRVPARRARCPAGCGAWRRGTPRAGPPRRTPERHVVDEHPAVDLGEVHPPLPAVDERVERTDDVVAVDAEIEREVVARARRDAGVRQSELGGDGSHDRLRAVSPGHGQRVRTAFDGVADERLEVVAPLQLDRLDPPARASSARAKRSALPPPDFGL